MGFDEIGFGAAGTLDIIGWQDEQTGAIFPMMPGNMLPRGGQGFRPIARGQMPGALARGGAPMAPPQQTYPNPYGAAAQLPVIGERPGQMVFPTNNPARPGIMRREVLPLGNFVVPASGTLLISTKPQKAFRVERLVLVTFPVAPGTATSTLVLNDFVVGTSPQFVASGDISTTCFSPDAIDTSLRGDTATAGVDVNLRFTNLSTTDAVRISGMIVGASIDQ